MSTEEKKEYKDVLSYTLSLSAVTVGLTLQGALTLVVLALTILYWVQKNIFNLIREIKELKKKKQAEKDHQNHDKMKAG
jgi:hypothetical protein